MADDADGFAAGVQGIQRVERDVQGFGVQRAKPFVQEQRVNACFMAHQIRERQRQRQADQEAFATGKRARVANRIGLPGIHHFQLQLFAEFALQHIAPVQPVELLVRQPHQVIEGQALGEFAEFIAFLRTD